MEYDSQLTEISQALDYIKAYSDGRLQDVPFSIEKKEYIPCVTPGGLFRAADGGTVIIYRDEPDVYAHEFTHATDYYNHPEWFPLKSNASIDRLRARSIGNHAIEAFRICGNDVRGMRIVDKLKYMAFYLLEALEIRANIVSSLCAGKLDRFLGDVFLCEGAIEYAEYVFPDAVEGYTIEAVKRRISLVRAFSEDITIECAAKVFKALEEDPVFVRTGF